MMKMMRRRIINSLIPGMRRRRTKRTTMIMTVSAGAETTNMDIQVGEDLLIVDAHRSGIVRVAAAGDSPPWTGTR
jgi:hypothetical protein